MVLLIFLDYNCHHPGCQSCGLRLMGFGVLTRSGGLQSLNKIWRAAVRCNEQDIACDGGANRYSTLLPIPSLTGTSEQCHPTNCYKTHVPHPFSKPVLFTCHSLYQPFHHTPLLSIILPLILLLHKGSCFSF